MFEIEKIDLGLDSTGRGGDSQRTAFEKCNDNFSTLTKDINSLVKNIDTVVKNSETNFAKSGENSDITNLKGLTQNIIQPADARDNMGSVTLRQLNAAVANAPSGGGGVTRIMSDFLGSIQWFNGSRAALPKGFVAADGQLLKRNDYPEIWTLISNNNLNVVSDKEWLGSRSKRASFSTGNDTTTFRVPDINGIQDGSYKGLFIRGDGYSPSGTVLGDAIRNITGKIAAAGAVAWQDPSGAFSLYGGVAGYSAQHPNGTLIPTQLEFRASRVVPTSEENRPVSANYIAIIRVSGVIQIDTQQEITSAIDKTLNTNDIVYGGNSESVVFNKGKKYSSSGIKSIKTVGVAGTGIQFNTSDYSTNPPTTRQYTLNSNSGDILTYSSPADGRNKLGLGSASTYNVGQRGSSIPTLDQTNEFSKPQAIKTWGGGSSNLWLENYASWGHEGEVQVGVCYRGPMLTTACSTWGHNQQGIRADFFVEEKAGYATHAVISLQDWGQGLHYWIFKSDNNAYSSGTWVSSSDERLKTDFKIISAGINILDQCKTFRGYTFKRRTNNNYEAGFKAQDIKNVLPESVYVNQDITLKDGTIVKNALSLDYGAMAAYNHECILALISRLEKAEQTINSLKEKLEQNAV